MALTLCSFLLSTASTSAQCSSIYILRPNSVTQSSFPALVQVNDVALYEYASGERVMAEICEAGSYEFTVREHPDSAALGRRVLYLNSPADYYVKISTLPITGTPIFTWMKPGRGQKLLNNDKRFDGPLESIAFVGPNSPPEVIRSPEAATQKSFTEARTQQIGFNPVQTVGNFKFELTDVVRVGRTGRLEFKVTNLAGRDLLVTLNNRLATFYDDAGTVSMANKICISRTCHNYNGALEDSQVSAEKNFKYLHDHKPVNFPSGIPLKCTVYFDKIDQSAEEFAKFSLWVASKDAGQQTPNVFNIQYHKVAFPSLTDEKTPNLRSFGSQSLEVVMAQLKGGEAVVQVQIKNGGTNSYLYKLTSATVYDELGNITEMNAMQFGGDTKPLPYQHQWQQTIGAESSVNASLFFKDFDPKAQLIKRFTLRFQQYEFNWNDLALTGGGGSGTLVNTSSPNKPRAGYITYQELRQNSATPTRIAGKKVVLRKLTFNSGSDELQPGSFGQLDELADLLTANPDLNVEVSGHTDNVGTPTDNYLLSQKRADAIKYYLIGRSISPDRVTSAGKGETEPFDGNDTKAGRLRNRRVEIKVNG